MKRITDIKKIQKIELDLLEYFDKICKQNNLNYFLAGGTLLGAVRHKGFIPWDDDIDVAMPREDYNKLLNLKLESNYKILSIENEKKYPMCFAKLINKNTHVKEKGIVEYEQYGIFIDIFPLDGLGNNKKQAEKLGKKIMFLRKIHLIIVRQLNNKITFKNIIKGIVKLIDIKFIYNVILKNATKYSFYESEYVGSIVGGAKGLDEIFERKIYSESLEMKFEGKSFKGMKYYNEYLSRMYGNYMEIPPVEKRGGHHTIECYLKEEGDEES